MPPSGGGPRAPQPWPLPKLQSNQVAPGHAEQRSPGQQGAGEVALARSIIRMQTAQGGALWSRAHLAQAMAAWHTMMQATRMPHAHHVPNAHHALYERLHAIHCMNVTVPIHVTVSDMHPMYPPPCTSYAWPVHTLCLPHVHPTHRGPLQSTWQQQGSGCQACSKIMRCFKRKRRCVGKAYHARSMHHSKGLAVVPASDLCMHTPS